MVDVLLASDNITVLGGPSRLDVDLNVGASGTRGSLFFVGTQNPSTLTSSQDFPTPPVFFDIFINANASSEDYLQAYQYVSQDGEPVWVETFKLRQDVYRINKVLDFENGSSSVDINLSELGLDTVPFESETNSSAYFNVQATLSGSEISFPETATPVSFSVEVGDAYFDNSGNVSPAEFPWFLPVTFNAVEFDGSSWADVDQKEMIAYMTIAFANPNEIFNIIVQNNQGES
jgi:hypothetical protein